MIVKNFNFLVHHHKDKQTALGIMFDVPQSNISDYLHRKKPIPTKILKCISIRYGVSVDDLMNKDLSLEYDSPQTVTLNDAILFSDNMFPILTSNIARTDLNFTQAYDILQRSLQINSIAEFDGKIFSLEHAVSLFQKAWKKTSTYVALSNSLTAIMLIYAFYSQRGLAIGEKLIKNGSISSADIQNCFLRDPSKPILPNPYEQRKKAFFEKYDDLVYRNIKLLKNNPRFSALGDFYLAMCYFFGFAEDFMEYEACSQAGVYMLIQLCKLENAYAEKFLESISILS